MMKPHLSLLLFLTIVILSALYPQKSRATACAPENARICTLIQEIEDGLDHQDIQNNTAENHTKTISLRVLAVAYTYLKDDENAHKYYLLAKEREDNRNTFTQGQMLEQYIYRKEYAKARKELNNEVHYNTCATVIQALAYQKEYKRIKEILMNTVCTARYISHALLKHTSNEIHWLHQYLTSINKKVLANNKSHASKKSKRMPICGNGEEIAHKSKGKERLWEWESGSLQSVLNRRKRDENKIQKGIENISFSLQVKLRQAVSGFQSSSLFFKNTKEASAKNQDIRILLGIFYNAGIKGELLIRHDRIEKLNQTSTDHLKILLQTNISDDLKHQILSKLISRSKLRYNSITSSNFDTERYLKGKKLENTIQNYLLERSPLSTNLIKKVYNTYNHRNMHSQANNLKNRYIQIQNSAGENTPPDLFTEKPLNNKQQDNDEAQKQNNLVNQLYEQLLQKNGYKAFQFTPLFVTCTHPT